MSSPSRIGIDSPAVPSSIAMQCECPLPKSMSSGLMFSVLFLALCATGGAIQARAGRFDETMRGYGPPSDAPITVP